MIKEACESADIFELDKLNVKKRADNYRIIVGLGKPHC